MLCLYMAIACPAYGQSEPVFATNYDLQFSVDGAISRVRSRARVRSGHAIPVELSRYRIDILFHERPGEEIELELQLFEKSQGSWYRLDVGALQFSASSGIPVEFSWNSGGMEIELALVVSPET